MRQLVPILRRFDMIQVVKLHETGKNPKNFAEIVFSKLVKSPRRKKFWNLFTWPERKKERKKEVNFLWCSTYIKYKKSIIYKNS